MLRRLVVLVAVLAVVSGSMTGPVDAVDEATGPQVAFSSGFNSDVYVVPAAGGTEVNLTDQPASDPSGWDASPSWSPDGSQIAFISDRDGNPDIWVMDADGGNRANLTASIEHETDPEWSPDGSRIAYSASLETKLPDGSFSWSPAPSIFVINLATGATIRLSVPDPHLPSGNWAIDADDTQPTWSPDGETIAFARHYRGGTPTAQTTLVYTVGADGGEPATFLAAGSWAIRGVDWSPDGASIVWSEVAPHGGSARLVRWDVAGGTESEIVVPLGFSAYVQPAISTDGSQLAFLAYTLNQGPAALHVWQLDGTEQPRMLTTTNWDSSLAWQPWYPSAGLVDPAAGHWALREEGMETRFYFGNPGDYPFVGDWDCSGNATSGLYRQSDGYVYLRNSNTQGNADIRFFFGNPGDIPLAGDFDGDGCDTVSIYRPSEARFYIINELGDDEGGLGAAEYSFLFGDMGDKPVVGDWDGDGIDEIGLHRESTGFFYYRNTLTTGIADGQFYFGDPGDRFIAGDWGGTEGQETPAVFRPSDTTFYFRHTLTQGNADSQFIWPGAGTNWLPVAGDFNLD